jgi:prepilin-type N-terminal cleavage/methylation domain-containing protein
VTNRRAAFSLPEIMVSLAILAIVSVFLMDMLSRQAKTYQVVDQVAEAQTNLRVITDLLEQEIRVTGFMVPEGAAICAVDNTDAPDILVVTDAAVINPTSQIQNDLGIDIASGYDGNGLDSLTLTGDGTIDSNPFYDSDSDGVADTDLIHVFDQGQVGGIIITDRNNPSRGSSCGQIVAGSLALGGSTLQVQIDYAFGGTDASQPLAPLPAGSNPEDLVAIPATVYRVNGANQLTRNGVLLAEDVEDMQLALHFDLDDDGEVDGDPRPTPQFPPFVSDTEYPGSTSGGVQYDSGSWDHSTLREVRLSIVIRTRAQDPAVVENPSLATNTFIAMENRNPPAMLADGFRRRVLTMTVQPRNLGKR